jgi:hypothetical protein
MKLTSAETDFLFNVFTKEAARIKPSTFEFLNTLSQVQWTKWEKGIVGQDAAGNPVQYPADKDSFFTNRIEEPTFGTHAELTPEYSRSFRLKSPTGEVIEFYKDQEGQGVAKDHDGAWYAVDLDSVYAHAKELGNFTANKEQLANIAKRKRTQSAKGLISNLSRVLSDQQDTAGIQEIQRAIENPKQQLAGSIFDISERKTTLSAAAKKGMVIENIDYDTVSQNDSDVPKLPVTVYSVIFKTKPEGESKFTESNTRNFCVPQEKNNPELFLAYLMTYQSTDKNDISRSNHVGRYFGALESQYSELYQHDGIVFSFRTPDENSYSGRIYTEDA